jgi:two-component system, chemotaxis family, sensor kinase CheA
MSLRETMSLETMSLENIANDIPGRIEPASRRRFVRSRLVALIKGVKHAAGTMVGVFRSKYIELILAVSLFIILDAGVLIINFYTSYQIANDAHAIQIASRMSTLSQNLFHQLYQVQEDVTAPAADYMVTIDRFAKDYKVFDETLDAFIYGGELIGQEQGQNALLQDTVYRDTSAHLLKDAEEIWKVFRVKFKPIVYAYFTGADRGELIEATAGAIAYSRVQNENLLGLLQSFSNAVEGVAQRKAERMRGIQSIGISLAVVNFFLILFHFLKRLRHSDALIEKSRKETTDILENVNEGLFLLDKAFTIGSQHSQSLHTFFKEDVLAGRNFIDLLRPLVTEKTLDTVKDYTDILFSRRVNESLVADLNPLNQVEIHQGVVGASFDIRYFSFQFSRVFENRELNALLVTVKDITEQVRLSDQLKVANERVSKEIDMLLAIIHVENNMLTDFVRAAENGLHEVNDILKTRDKGVDSPKNKLAKISRIVHKLKGDSTTIGLEFVVEKIHNFETAIRVLREQQHLTGQDFLPLVVHLNQLMSDFALIRNLEERMPAAEPTPRNGKSVADSTGLTQGVNWENQMAALVERVAADHGKQVSLDMSDFKADLLTPVQLEPVKDILVQSLRNSVVHGLETPDLRQKASKTAAGNIKVTLAMNGNGLQLTVRDDGQGIDLEKIKTTARRKGLASEDQLKDWQPAKVLSLIFRHGFSTATENGVHAGQGVGLDLVRSRLISLNGRTQIKFQPGRYTEFQYHFDSHSSIPQGP